MKKGLFLAVTSVTAVLLVTQIVDVYRLGQIDGRLQGLSASLNAQGWHVSWQHKARLWRPWGSRIELTAPLANGQRGEGWAVQKLIIKADRLHPFSVLFETRGIQILRTRRNMVLNAGDGSGLYDPARRMIIYQTAGATASGLPISGIETLTLRDVTLRLLPGGDHADPSLLWSLEVQAARLEPKLNAAQTGGGLAPSLSDLMAALPAPTHCRLILAAIGQKEPSHRTANGADPAPFSQHTGYERFLIQEASLTLGPLSVTARGTLTASGEGTLWAHLTGLQNFARYWVAHTPATLRNNPDYARLLAGLDEQTARIPDHLDMPIPVGRDDILLQNHISAIITGHYR